GAAYAAGGAAGSGAPRGGRATDLRRGEPCPRHPDRHGDVTPVARARAAAPAPRRADGRAAKSGEMKQITESDLHAYVDGRLSAADRTEVEAYIVDHPEEAERVKAWREQSSALRALYDPILEEPVPAELAAIPPRPAWHRYALAASFFFVGIATGWVAKTALVPGAPQALSLPRQAAIAHVVYAPEV